eukprot:TRINITY_DN5227_c0_g1_i7.p1 TRINITY_DN5227_c0_g1~~TRINITY_DN5227_c0_g1_i7.p1  ORF type:complete len:154 (-),score=11.14 TRINITY_DN5227_c0_g1_i7:2-463(-)
MIDLGTWRAVIGLFCGKVQGGSNVYQKQWRDSDADEHMSSTDVVIVFIFCCLLMALIHSACNNVFRVLSLDSAWLSEHVHTKSTLSCVEDVLCVRSSAWQVAAAIHAPVLVSVLCVQHAVFSLRRLLLSGDVETNHGPDHDDKLNTNDPCTLR